MGGAAQITALAALGTALIVLVVALTRRELSDRARREEPARQPAQSQLQGRRVPSVATPERETAIGGLTPAERARLEAFRSRARLLSAAGEPLGPLGWRLRLRVARRSHMMLLIVAVVGCANLAMHFGAAALLLGSSLLVAGIITLLSTMALSVLAIATILGLLSSG